MMNGFLQARFNRSLYVGHFFCVYKFCGHLHRNNEFHLDIAKLHTGFNQYTNFQLGPNIGRAYNKRNTNRETRASYFLLLLLLLSLP